MQGSQQGNSGYLNEMPAGRPNWMVMSKPIPENLLSACSGPAEPGAGALCLAGAGPDSPPLAWRYGLYSVPPVMEAWPPCMTACWTSYCSLRS